MHTQYVQLPFDTYVIDCCIIKDIKYKLYFGDYLGALDGIYIPASISYTNRVPYQN